MVIGLFGLIIVFLAIAAYVSARRGEAGFAILYAILIAFNVIYYFLVT